MERNANAYYDLLAATVELFNQRIQSDEIAEGDDYLEALHEVVDGQVPHYYHEIFTVMAADGIDNEFSDSDMCPDTKDVSRICQARIYEQLYNDVPAHDDIVWFEGPEEDDGEASTAYFVCWNDSLGKDSCMVPNLKDAEAYYSFESAKEAALKFYKEQGIECHVEGDSTEWLFDVVGAEEAK